MKRNSNQERRQSLPYTPGAATPAVADYRAAVAQVEARLRKGGWGKFAFEGDVVVRQPGGSRLQVRSMLFDDLLVGPAPLRFEGEVYQPLHWYEEGRGLRRRLVYELEKVSADPEGTYAEYTQPRRPERQQVVEALTRRRDRVQIFAPLWGLYPRADQLHLQEKFRFAATRWTATTASVLLFCGAMQLWVARLTGRTIFSLAAAVYLIVESFYRLYVSRVRGQPAGSLAGDLLRLVLRSPE